MTPDEVVFWNHGHEHVLRRFGYSVVGLNLDSSGKCYWLKLNRFGGPESGARIFPVFVDQLKNCVETGQMPEGLLRSFADELGVAKAVWRM
jgi:hypothetical protein